MHPETTMLETSKVPGTNVFSNAKEEIGEVDDLIVDTATGKVRYAVLSFGGFLGLGREHYVVPWSALEWNSELNGYTTSVTEDQLKLAPDLDPLSVRDRAMEQRLHDAYGARSYWETEASTATRR